MKLKEIHRTSTFAWSPASTLPVLATGTVAGALDESFSNASKLEIWAPDFLDKNEFDLGKDGLAGPKGFVEDTSRFNRLAWGSVNAKYPQGVIAAGMENGELALWDPSKILASAGSTDSLILRNTTHTGPIRGLDFNPTQAHLLASGGTSGEVYIWDLNNPTTPRGPTDSKSTKLDEITSLAWNRQVAHVMAGASTTGYTVVWDLRGKREVVALAYGGGAGTKGGPALGGGQAIGGRRGMSAIAWHPDNATRLVTASEDDSSPVIMVWDLRNARAPEKILSGHEKGVLSLSWCKQDADLLLSCGKDNRALCWNPQTSEVIGELPSADNWAFQVEWCPRNPDMLATAFFDGTIGIHSIQNTNEETAPAAQAQAAAAPQADGADIFDAPGFGLENKRSTGTFSLKQPPQWLRRPASSSFGFGGQLVTSTSKSSTVSVKKVVTEAELIERVNSLQAAVADESLATFAEGKTGGDVESWKALRSLFNANSRDELVTLLGYSKEDIRDKVTEAVARLKRDVTIKKINEDEEVADIKLHEPVVSFAEPEAAVSSDEEPSEAEKAELTPSEFSTSAVSDATRQADEESTTTAPSLFGDNDLLGTPQSDAAALFFSTVAVGSQNASDQVLVPHTNYGIDSSVAATAGSGPSSVASESLKSNTFRIYPSHESEIDRLVTKALVLGDFASAVSLCLSSDRFADAILLAVKGGPELLQKTQKVYFERQTASLPYLRVFQSIVTNDLADIVQNADLQEWQEIFVVVCTFASAEEFPALTEQLGQRLEFQFNLAKLSEDAESAAKAREFRKNAILTYLAAGRLERLVNIWIDELVEEEKRLSTEDNAIKGSQYTAHAHALQTFIEKVTVFRSATKYADADLESKSGEDAAAKTYKLGTLYDRYFEYADLLAAQGLTTDAVSFLKLTPVDYSGPVSSLLDLKSSRERLFAAAKVVAAPAVPEKSTVKPAAAAPSNVYGAYPASTSAPSADYGPYGAAAPAPAAPAQRNNYPAYPNQAPAAYPTAPNGTYQPASTSYNVQSNQPYGAAATNPSYQPAGYQAPLGYSQNIAPPAPAAPPIRATPPPPPKRDAGGWNDAPAIKEGKRAPSSLGPAKPSAIVSPFPNAQPSTPGSPFTPGVTGPPPRPGSTQLPPPPQAGQRLQGPPPPRVGSTGPYPPPRVGSTGPISPPPPPRQGTPSQYGAPPPRAGQPPPPPAGNFATSTPPPPRQAPGPPPPAGAYARATPPPQPQSGPYAAPPSQGQPPYNPNQPPSQSPPSQGPYGPPPGAQRGQTQPPLPPLGRGGPPAPPPGGQAPPPAAAKPRGPPPPKYPPGDRSHIPETSKPIFETLSSNLARLKQTSPPQQQRLIDDLQRRLGPLFDALNCETLSQPSVEQLLEIAQAIRNGDRELALAVHIDLLTKGAPSDNLGAWMSGVKQLIMLS